MDELLHANMTSMKLKNLAPLTQADEDRLAALAARPDSDIDLGNLPEFGPDNWKNAVRSKRYRPVKAQITASIDKDV